MTQLKKTLSLTALALLGGCMLSLTSCKKEPQKKDQEVNISAKTKCPPSYETKCPLRIV